MSGGILFVKTLEIRLASHLAMPATLTTDYSGMGGIEQMMQMVLDAAVQTHLCASPTSLKCYSCTEVQKANCLHIVSRPFRPGIWLRRAIRFRPQDGDKLYKSL